MRSILYSILLFAFGVNLGLAQEEVLSFKNVREGKSYYSGNAKDRAVSKVLKVINKEEISRIYNEAFSTLDKKKSLQL